MVSGPRGDVDHLIALTVDDAADRTYRLMSGRPVNQVLAHLVREFATAGVDAHVSHQAAHEIAEAVAEGRRPPGLVPPVR